MGKLLDDLNRLSAVSAQGNVLKKSLPTRSNLSEISTNTTTPSWIHAEEAAASPSRSCACGITKTSLVPQHSSCDFVTKHYEVVRELGRGSFSHVKLVRERRTGHERVCKVVRTDQMPPEVLQLTKTEVQVLATLDHPYIVKLYEYAEDAARHKLVLILEYIAGGDCNGLLEDSGRTLGEAQVARLIHQLLVAVNCCHSRGIAHRDLKPLNMMLTRSLGPWGSPNLKVIDFGLAASSRTSRDFVGTPAYMPPEVLAGTVDCTFQADMWSIGVAAAELLAGEPPFGRPEDYGGDMAPVFESIRGFRSFEDITDSLEDMPNWAGRSNEAKDFVRRLLRLDPERRPTASEALGHPWLERCREVQVGLGVDMVRSMVDYAAAPPLARCCMLAIAARTGISEIARVGAAFADADADDDGSILQEEFVDAIASTSTCGWTHIEVDVGEVFAAADLGQSGRLGFTEFAAAVLFTRFNGSLDRLAEQAFCALDCDRDGWVRPSDIRPFLSSEARSSLSLPPEGRAFDVREWCSCVRRASSPHLDGSDDGRSSRSSRSREMPVLEEGSGTHMIGLFKRFLFERLFCSTCEQCRDDDEGSWRRDAPVVVSNCNDPTREVSVPASYETSDLRVV